MFEWCADEAPAAAQLTLTVEADNPARMLVRAALGERPGIQIEGDTALAADIDWLVHNLRWDVAADLERVLGPLAARQLQTVGSGLARALRGALAGAAALRPGAQPRQPRQP